MDQTFKDGGGWLYVVGVEQETPSQSDATSQEDSDIDVDGPTDFHTTLQHQLAPHTTLTVPFRHPPSLHTHQNPLPPTPYTTKLLATYATFIVKYATPYKWSFIPLGASYASVVKYTATPPYSVTEEECSRYTFLYMCHTLVVDVPCGEHGVIMKVVMMKGVGRIGEEHCVEAEGELEEGCPLCSGYRERGREEGRKRKASALEANRGGDGVDV